MAGKQRGTTCELEAEAGFVFTLSAGTGIYLGKKTGGERGVAGGLGAGVTGTVS